MGKRELKVREASEDKNRQEAGWKIFPDIKHLVNSILLHLFSEPEILGEKIARLIPLIGS